MEWAIPKLDKDLLKCKQGFAYHQSGTSKIFAELTNANTSRSANVRKIRSFDIWVDPIQELIVFDQV
jgi:hypothetical protein